MTDIILPSALRIARSQFRYIDQTGMSRGVYSGVPQTTAYGGDRVGATIEFTPHGGGSATGRSERARLRALIMSLRGKQNRIYIADDSHTRQGSFPASELFANADFSNGTTGWIAANSALRSVDGALRVTASVSGASSGVYQSVALTQYAPHVLRSLIIPGSMPTTLVIGPYLQDGAVASANLATTRGYLLTTLVPISAAAAANYPVIYDFGAMAGVYLDMRLASLSRCFLVDGSPNLFLQSDNFSATWASGGVGSSVVANQGTAPDGSVTMDYIRESNSTAGEHYVYQNITVTSAGQDIAASVSIAPVTRNWAVLRMYEQPGNTFCAVWVNLSTGALGSFQTGANWSSVRASVINQGGGIYRLTLIGRKTNSSTSIQALINSATADLQFSYAGAAGTDAISLWRGAIAPSSVAMRGVQTTTTAAASQSQTGSAIYVKGLPASTNGLLLSGDWFELDGQMKILTESLDSDAAGCGFLQFLPPLARPVADNTPIIVHRPMGRFMFAGDSPGWNNEPGVFSTASLDFEEAPLT